MDGVPDGDDVRTGDDMANGNGICDMVRIWLAEYEKSGSDEWNLRMARAV